MKSELKKGITYILTLLARATLAIHGPTIIAVTGNIGKTSTKDAIASVLGAQYATRASYKSFNSDIGVPLTILGEDNQWSNVLGWMGVIVRSTLRLILQEEYPRYLVVEVGADYPKDIYTITRWLRPDIAVLTQFGEVPVHIENFNNDRKLIVNEKAHLPRALKKGGTFVYYGDDADCVYIAESIEQNKVTFGFGSQNTVQIVSTTPTYEKNGAPEGMKYVLHAGSYGELSFVKKGFLGNTYAVAAAAACAVAEYCGVDKNKIEEALTAYIPEPGRMRIVPGIKNTTLIDDTYNAAPKAVMHALDTLGSLDVQAKKVALLGDMLELGKHTEKAHREVGIKAASVAHTLITVGIRARFIVQGALDGGMKDEQIFQFEDSRSAGKFAESIVNEGDVVLLKASQGIRMERATEELLRYPELAPEFLPRQSTEWKKR
jgi:UDP-N-acetylmuramyl pentapeptide synthase